MAIAVSTVTQEGVVSVIEAARAVVAKVGVAAEIKARTPRLWVRRGVSVRCRFGMRSRMGEWSRISMRGRLGMGGRVSVRAWVSMGAGVGMRSWFGVRSGPWCTQNRGASKEQS